MLELSKERILEILKADIDVGDRIISSEKNKTVVAAVKERKQACLQLEAMVKDRNPVEISLVNQDFDLEEEVRALFAWSAAPHTISECEDWMKALINKLKGGQHD